MQRSFLVPHAVKLDLVKGAYYLKALILTWQSKQQLTNHGYLAHYYRTGPAVEGKIDAGRRSR